MVTRTIIFVMAIAATAFVVIATYGPGPSIGGTDLAQQQEQEGCASCHATLSNTVPQGHSKVTPDEVKYCLGCHSQKGPAVAFNWVIHLKHYAELAFAGDCWACHQIDKAGNFKLIGGGEGTPIKVTKEQADQMVKYFRSWATSEYKDEEGKVKLGLDRKHALQRVTCGRCHGTFFPEERASMDRCLGCHGSYSKLAARSAAKKVEPNPHDSHLGEAPCTACHHDHKPSVLYCNECHSFDLKVP